MGDILKTQTTEWERPEFPKEVLQYVNTHPHLLSLLYDLDLLPEQLGSQDEVTTGLKTAYFRFADVFMAFKAGHESAKIEATND